MEFFGIYQYLLLCMKINFEKIQRFADIAMLLTLVIGLIMHIEFLDKNNYNLKLKIITKNEMILNTVRNYEYEKSIKYLELLECQGEYKKKN